MTPPLPQRKDLTGVVLPGDPLLLAPAPDEEHGPRPFWASYVKGMARATTALALLSLAFEPGGPLPAGNCFLQSVAVVHCRRGIAAVDRATVALENARLSARGSIRRAHDVITWVGTLYRLQIQCKLSPASVLKTWNATATTQAQVTGNKRMCCLSLLEKAPEKAIQLLLDHVSEHGADQSAFMEDAFANKKILPGSVWLKRV